MVGWGVGEDGEEAKLGEDDKKGSWEIIVSTEQ